MSPPLVFDAITSAIDLWHEVRSAPDEERCWHDYRRRVTRGRPRRGPRR